MSSDGTPPGGGKGNKDLDDGLRFLHVLGMQGRMVADDASLRLAALVEELVSAGVIDQGRYDARRELLEKRGLDESEREGQVAVHVGTDVDKYAITELPDIDCEARFPLCHARCCTLDFALSIQDLDERVVRWDYARPYHIRHRSDDYCCHNDPATGGCTVYQNRPAICRTYSCREDKRIWIDFDKRIPAPLYTDTQDPEFQDPEFQDPGSSEG